jgi:ribosomal protein S18 acetylase RimI-like enzyme
VSSADALPVILRQTLESGDEERVRTIVRSTGFFSSEEEDIAAELVRDTLRLGSETGYSFLFLSAGETCMAYSCFGRIPGTDSSFDLYWIATDANWRGRGHGKRLLTATEASIAELSGTRVYVDTSSREQYRPTRAFYEACGYERAAELPDFYRPGDGKVVYCKVLVSVTG